MYFEFWVKSLKIAKLNFGYVIQFWCQNLKIRVFSKRRGDGGMEVGWHSKQRGARASLVCVSRLLSFGSCTSRPRAWVLRFVAGSWSPAAGFSSSAVLQRPAFRARRLCRCRLRETGHIPSASTAPHRPRRVQEPKESRQETHERPSVYYVTEITYRVATRLQRDLYT